jgi:hypothetical protein
MRIGLVDMDIAVYHCASSCAREHNFESVKRTVDLYLKEWLRQAEATHYLGFLTDGPKNFRIARATTWKYKGGRPSVKPKWYAEIREYLMNHWEAQLISGMEADDALSIAQTYFQSQGVEAIIITADKDLLQVPGWHLNLYKSPVPFEVSEAEGERFLWLQVITGDVATDNIPGVGHAITETTTGSFNRTIKADDAIVGREKLKHYKRYSSQELYGPANAKKYLEQYPLDEWAMRVWELYVDKYEDDDGDEGYGDLRFMETFDLIFMLREPMIDVDIHYRYREPPIEEDLVGMFEDF